METTVRITEPTVLRTQRHIDTTPSHSSTTCTQKRKQKFVNPRS